MTITNTVKSMQEQNEIFAAMEPIRFKRVHVMAEDLERTIGEEYEKNLKKQVKRQEDGVGVIKQNNDRYLQGSQATIKGEQS